MDDGMWLQVMMPAADFPVFLNNTPFKGVGLRRDLYMLNQFREFWQCPPKKHRSAQQHLPNGRFLNMLVDETDSENVIVYLMWHET